MSAQQVFQRLQELGYDGGASIVRAYVRQVRPRRPPAYLTLSFAAGESAQVDWGSYGVVPVGETRRRLSVFVMVLCYSRLLYLEFTLSQTMEQYLQTVRPMHLKHVAPSRAHADLVVPGEGSQASVVDLILRAL